MAARWIIGAACALCAVLTHRRALAELPPIDDSTRVPPAATAPPQSDAQPRATASPLPPRAVDPGAPKPPPLHVDYAQYGVAITAEANISSGATCRVVVDGRIQPCILGSGGGIAIRGGYRSPGPWYFGGAYEFSKMDSSNLYRLGILQQLRAEARYIVDTGYRLQPYATGGLGGIVYGNEWGVETGGAEVFAGAGVSFEVSRLAQIGVGFVYRPVLIASWTDTAGNDRPLGLAQFLSFDVQLELRSELGRR